MTGSGAAPIFKVKLREMGARWRGLPDKHISSRGKWTRCADRRGPNRSEMDVLDFPVEFSLH
jgi:hypothetical protein